MRTDGGHRTRPADQCWRNTVRYGWLTQVGELKLTGPVTLSAVFVGAHPRADIDNLIKSVFEALQGVGWEGDDGMKPAFSDDRQVRTLRYVTSIAETNRPAAGCGVWVMIEHEGSD